MDSQLSHVLQLVHIGIASTYKDATCCLLSFTHMQSQRFALRYISPKGDRATDFRSKAIMRNEDDIMMYETSWDIMKRCSASINELVAKGYKFVGVIER